MLYKLLTHIWRWNKVWSNQSVLKEISPKYSLEAETPILWPPDVKNWLIGKDRDARKDWRQEEKGMTEDEIVGWHHRLNGHEFEQAPGVGDDREAWHAAVHGVTKSWMQLSDWTTTDRERENIYILSHMPTHICVFISRSISRWIYSKSWVHSANLWFQSKNTGFILALLFSYL